jgi:hypothetical protein
LTANEHTALNNLLATSSFINFVSAATTYCHTIETLETDDPKFFLQILQRLLATLYTLGLELPSTSVIPIIDEEIPIPDIDMKPVLQHITQRVQFSYYSVVLNPLDLVNNAELGTGDLTDDLGDIYHDLKRGLMLLNNPEPSSKATAIWELQFRCNHHWNQHCIEALQVITEYLYKKPVGYN